MDNPMKLPWKREPCENPKDVTRTVDSGGHLVFADNSGPNVREADFIIDCVNKVHNANKLIRKLGCWYAEKTKIEEMVGELVTRLESMNFNYVSYGPDFIVNKELIRGARKLLEEYKDETA